MEYMEENGSTKEDNFLIGQRIKRLRDRKGLKQDYVAERLGISSGHYSNIENGHKSCTLSVLIRLCRVLDTTPNEILRDCIQIENNEGNSWLVEMQRPLKQNEREFLYALQLAVNTYLDQGE